MAMYSADENAFSVNKEGTVEKKWVENLIAWHKWFIASWKLCLNLCSLKWFRPSLSLVVNLIPLALWEHVDSLTALRVSKSRV